jgi:hypothetical protein
MTSYRADDPERRQTRGSLGVIGNFERMDRIADGTGIPLDNMVNALSGDIREELGLEDYESRRVSASSLFTKTVGPVMRGIAKLGLRFASKGGRLG